jgi:hypothetical protein
MDGSKVKISSKGEDKTQELLLLKRVGRISEKQIKWCSNLGCKSSQILYPNEMFLSFDEVVIDIGRYNLIRFFTLLYRDLSNSIQNKEAKKIFNFVKNYIDELEDYLDDPIHPEIQRNIGNYAWRFREISFLMQNKLDNAYVSVEKQKYLQYYYYSRIFISANIIRFDKDVFWGEEIRASMNCYDNLNNSHNKIKKTKSFREIFCDFLLGLTPKDILL